MGYRAVLRCGLVLVLVCIPAAVVAQEGGQPAEGAENGACYGNNTCNAGLECVDNICVSVKVEAGAENGPCYGNGTCNQGLTCEPSSQTCVAAAANTGTGTGGGMGGANNAGAGGAAGGQQTGTGTEGTPGVATGSCYGCPGSIGITAQVGALFPGSAYVEVIDTSVDTDAGFLVHIDADYQIANKVSIGAFLLYAAAGAEGEDLSVTTVGATFKGSFALEKVVLRPGLALAYQTISASGVSDDSTGGLDIGALFELIYPFNPKLAVAAQLGFITQPTGGNDLTDITFGPIFYATGGIGYLF